MGGKLDVDKYAPEAKRDASLCWSKLVSGCYGVPDKSKESVLSATQTKTHPQSKLQKLVPIVVSKNSVEVDAAGVENAAVRAHMVVIEKALRSCCEQIGGGDARLGTVVASGNTGECEKQV